MKTFVDVVVVFVLCAALGANAQAPSLCRPLEVYLTCGGCQKTCDDPDPACASVCRVGCYCPEGLVRAEDGDCVSLSKCPRDSSAGLAEGSDQEEDSDSEAPSDACGHNERYSLCEPCGNRTCDNLDAICPAQCARGCYCKEGYVRDSDGICIRAEECDSVELNVIRKEPPKCGPKEKFEECKTCEKTCSNPDPMCPAQCTRACVCSDGLVRAPDGDCVPLEKCPKEDCEDPNAEYACRRPCEQFCSDKPCEIRSAKCSVGCFCKNGFIKEDSTGKCVRWNKCITKKKKN